MKKRLFLQNAAILTGTSLLLRAVGMYFRIYISSVIGAQGVGLYQMILSVYALASGFAVSGIPAAVTRITADELACNNIEGARRGLRRCLAVSLGMGIISAALIFVLADVIGSSWLSDARAVASVRIMAGALPFMSISCCLRGYFTARRRVGVSSLSQITEQAVRIALCLVFLGHFSSGGIAGSCFAIMLADVISEAAGCLCVSAGYLADRRRLGTDAHTLLPPDGGYRAIADITVPITVSHYLTSILRTVESVLVPDCLCRYYLSRTRSLELFGMLRGMALPLIFFPSTLLTAFSSLLMPEISRQLALGDRRGIQLSVARTLRITFALSMPVAMLFFFYGREIASLVYDQPEIGNMLKVLSPLMPLMYAESVVVGLLRGLGEQKRSFYYSIADNVLRLVLIVAFVPRFGMFGFMLVMIVSNLLTPLLNITRLLRVSQTEFDVVGWVLRPLGCCAVCLCLLLGLSRLGIGDSMGSLMRICLGAGGTAVLYGTMIWLSDDGLSANRLRSFLPS